MRRHNPTAILYSLLLGFFLILPVFAAVVFPEARGPINDFAGVLDSQSKASLLSRVQSARDRTGDEIFVAIVPSLQGMTVEEYANRLFAMWRPGKKGKDNGLLVLVCPIERKVRIEVGYGLEGTITDGQAGGVIRTDFIPAFKKGDFAGGILAGVDHLARLLEVPRAATKEASEDDFLAPSFQVMVTIGLCLFTLVGSLFLGIGLGNKVILPVILGGLFTGMPLWLSFAVPDFHLARYFTALLALVGIILGFWLGKGSRDKGGTIGSNGSGGGWTWGRGGGSSGGSSWGGGGSSGGGGASGSW